MQISIEFRYSDLPKALGHTILVYKEFEKNWSGEWICVSEDNNNWYIWKDYFGSCIVCDKLGQAELEFEEKYHNSDNYTVEKQKFLLEFVSEYKPFAIINKKDINWINKIREALLLQLKIGGEITESDIENLFEETLKSISQGNFVGLQYDGMDRILNNEVIPTFNDLKAIKEFNKKQ